VALPGPAWTAQAGSGDTLAGSCAALLAAGRSAADAALLGASLQAAAAASAPGPLPPHVLAQRGAEELGRLQQRRLELLR
jgi:NAD(P)H-hydrate repair Nnr-like enzyme with NAD(P)H-hydrate dehydratase domain